MSPLGAPRQTCPGPRSLTVSPCSLRSRRGGRAWPHSGALSAGSRSVLGSPFPGAVPASSIFTFNNVVKTHSFLCVLFCPETRYRQARGRGALFHIPPVLMGPLTAEHEARSPQKHPDSLDGFTPQEPHSESPESRIGCPLPRGSVGQLWRFQSHLATMTH